MRSKEVGSDGNKGRSIDLRENRCVVRVQLNHNRVVTELTVVQNWNLDAWDAGSLPYGVARDFISIRLTVGHRFHFIKYLVAN